MSYKVLELHPVSENDTKATTETTNVTDSWMTTIWWLSGLIDKWSAWWKRLFSTLWLFATMYANAQNVPSSSTFIVDDTTNKVALVFTSYDNYKFSTDSHGRVVYHYANPNDPKMIAYNYNDYIPATVEGMDGSNYHENLIESVELIELTDGRNAWIVYLQPEFFTNRTTTYGPAHNFDYETRTTTTIANSSYRDDSSLIYNLSEWDNWITTIDIKHAWYMDLARNSTATENYEYMKYAGGLREGPMTITSDGSFSLMLTASDAALPAEYKPYLVANQNNIELTTGTTSITVTPSYTQNPDGTRTVSGTLPSGFEFNNTTTAQFTNQNLPNIPVSPEMGTNDVDTSTFQVAPNPVKEKLMIKSNEPIQQIWIYNMTWQHIKNIIPHGTIDVSHLTPGVYILRMEYRDGTIGSTKIIKK